MSELLYRLDHRHIVRRIIVSGTLVLDTPTCLGTGDTDNPIDMSLLRDNLEPKKALLIGSSIAGALRNYLREYNKGYGEIDLRDNLATKLFGDLFAYKNEKDQTEKDQTEKEKITLRERNIQSPLIVNDAISTQPIQAELRDGVKIDSSTRTAVEKAKYDLELLQAGTEFPLCFELLIEKDSDEPELCKGLAIALSGLEKGEISLGMKKRRGFGRCHVKEWQVWNFDLTDVGDRMAWLLFERECTKLPITGKIAHALGVALDEVEDKRDRFTINAKFTLASPLLIRAGHAKSDRAPDVVHLKSHRPPENNDTINNDTIEESDQHWHPVLSGTSLAGVLRHRAERIVKTIQLSFQQKPKSKQEPEIIKSMFGYAEDKSKTAKASRLIVEESVVKETTDLVQTRIAIDRFTGGAYHGALFQEQPIFPKDETTVEVKLELRNPEEYEIGLLLLLLKDLWTEDLPVGGASSVGRGRLKGEEATMISQTSEIEKKWKITQKDDGSLIVENLQNPSQPQEEVQNDLQNLFVSKLVDYIEKENYVQNCS